MKSTILTVLVTLILFNCGSQSQESTQSKVSAVDQSVIDSIGFETEILQQIRNYSDSSISILNTSFNVYNDSTQAFETIIKDYKGFSLRADEQTAREMVVELKDDLKHKGYLIYISETNFGYDSDEVSVLKSDDQFDILRVEETDGINYGLENADVLARLEEWNAKYPFEIIGAGLDWVEAIFIQQPEDMEQFANEVYEFCPDIVEQGTGTVEELVVEMERSGMLYLWWD